MQLLEMLQGICYRRYSTSHLNPKPGRLTLFSILKLDHAAIRCNCGMQDLRVYSLVVLAN